MAVSTSVAAVTFAADLDHCEQMLMHVYVRKLSHGDKVWTPARSIPGVKHYGIWDERSRAFIHNTTPGGVQFARPAAFINGKLFIETPAAPGSGEAVAARARALLGLDYDLFALNCEHVANIAAEGRRESQQLQTAVFAATVLGSLFLLSNSGSSKSYDASVDRYRDTRGRFASG
jgi:hypothetical protein